MPRGLNPGYGTNAWRNRFELATPTIENGKYNLALDLHQFKPEEVQVKMDEDGVLRVRGKREIKSENGYELREYVHNFTVPDTVHREQLTSKLDANGRLKIEAPLKIQEKQIEDGFKNIPIEFVRKHA